MGIAGLCPSYPLGLQSARVLRYTHVLDAARTSRMAAQAAVTQATVAAIVSTIRGFTSP